MYAITIPTLEEYTEALREFQSASSGWYGIDLSHFYSATTRGWYESSDKAQGGLDVSWAFHREASEEEIAEQYNALCEELRESLDDEEEE